MKTEADFCNEDPSAEVVFLNAAGLGDDGWAMLAPFGDYPGIAVMPDGMGGHQRQAAVQRYDREGCQTMVARFKSPVARLKRLFLGGVNIYNGHPDMPGGQAHWPDAEPKGVIADLQVREDGLYGMPVFNNAGIELLSAAEKKIGFSVRVGTSYVGEDQGRKVFRPDLLKSVGMTSTPNLPVEFLNGAESANATSPEAGQGKTNNERKEPGMDKKLIIALLTRLGIEMANEATDAQVLTALEKMGGDRATFANEKQGLTTQVGQLTTAATAKDTQIATLTQERDTARTEFANERKARIEAVLDQAVQAGRITAAQRPLWANRLQVDFANESAELAKLADNGALKTQGKTDNLGQRKVEMANAQQAFCAAVDAELKAGNLSRAQAVAKVVREKPEIYNAYLEVGGAL